MCSLYSAEPLYAKRAAVVNGSLEAPENETGMLRPAGSYPLWHTWVVRYQSLHQQQRQLQEQHVQSSLPVVKSHL